MADTTIKMQHQPEPTRFECHLAPFMADCAEAG
jgi:hypothetical protein